MKLVLTRLVDGPLDLRTAELTRMDGRVRPVDQVALGDQNVAGKCAVALRYGDLVAFDVTRIVGVVPSRLRTLCTLVTERMGLFGEQVRQCTFGNLHDDVSLSTYW